MENYDRFTEIQESAMNAEDASVLQYAKTLDSLETKLNKISNSFQQFYMQIANGPVVGGFLDVFNNIITNLSSYDPATAFAKVLTLISTIKNVVRLLFTFISSTTSQYFTSVKTNANAIFGDTKAWQSLGQKIGKWLGIGIEDGVNSQKPIDNALLGNTNGTGPTSFKDAKGFKEKLQVGWNALSSDNGIRALTAAGAGLSTLGLSLDTSTMTRYGWSTGLQAAGGLATTAAQFLSGNWLGGIVTGVSTISGLVENIAKWEEKQLENLKKEVEELNVERVEDKTEASELQSYIEKEEKLRLARHDSEEAAQEYIDVQNEIAEKYPQYISYIDESGNAIVSMSGATEDLTVALDKAADSTANWAKKAREAAQKEYEQALDKAGIASYDVDSTQSLGGQGVYNDINTAMSGEGVLDSFLAELGSSKEILIQAVDDLSQNSDFSDRV